MNDEPRSLPTADAWLRRVAVIFGLVFVGLALGLKPRLVGDGIYYALVAEAEYRHGSPEIRLSDVDRLEAVVANGGDGKPVRGAYYLSKIADQLRRGDCSGLFVVPVPGRQEYRSIHFVFYPLLTVPFRIVLDFLGLHPLKAFALANAGMLMVALLALARASGIPAGLRAALLGGMVSGGIMHYVFWSHPEMVTISFVILGLVNFLQGRNAWSAMGFGLASLQNPSFALALPVLFAAEVGQRWSEWSHDSHWAGVAGMLRRAVTYLPAGFICLVPYLFNYLTVGRSSPTFEGYIDLTLIGLTRFLSFLFDLNQGLVVGCPAALFLLGLGFVLGGKTLISARLRAQIDPRWWQAAVLLAVALSVSWPFLGQINWNGGQRWFLRYPAMVTPLYYGSAIILIWSLRAVLRGALGLLAAVMTAQAVFFLWSLTLATDADFVVFKPWARWVMNVAPALYSPDPEIFCERNEGWNEAMRLDCSLYYAPDGVGRKVMLREGSSPWNELLHGSRLALISADSGRPLEEDQFGASERGWRAGNGRMFIELRQPSTRLRFNSTAPPCDHLVLRSGWWPAEGWGVWSRRGQCEMTFALGWRPEHELTIRLSLANFGLPQRTVTIAVNGRTRVDLKMTPDVRTQEVEFDVPAAQLDDRGLVNLTMDVGDQVAQPNLNPAADPRRLGIGLIGLEATGK